MASSCAASAATDSRPPVVAAPWRMLRSVAVAPGTPAFQDTPLRADSRVEVLAACADCRLTAHAWMLSDGRPEPHRIPVTLTPAELHGAPHARTANGHGLHLAPGVWAVQSAGPSTPAATFQVTILPGDRDAVTLPP